MKAAKISQTAVIAAVVSLLILSFLAFGPSSARRGLKDFLNRSLVKTDGLPPGAFKAQGGNGAIYVLGGGKASLKGRFRAAAALYREGAAGKILIHSREGFTEDSSGEGGEMTNNEYSILTLAGFGVRPEDIEVVEVKKLLLGTYAEAKEVSRLASERRYDYLILVSSSYHTMRVSVIFSRFMDRDIRLYVYPSPSDAGLRVLLAEYIKLAVYRCLSMF